MFSYSVDKEKAFIILLPKRCGKKHKGEKKEKKKSEALSKWVG